MDFIGDLLKKYLRQLLRKQSSTKLSLKQKTAIETFEEQESFPIDIETVKKINKPTNKYTYSVAFEDSGSDGEFSSTEDDICALKRTQKLKKLKRLKKFGKVQFISDDLVFSIEGF